MPVLTPIPDHILVSEISRDRASRRWQVKGKDEGSIPVTVTLPRKGNPRLETLYHCNCAAQPRLSCSHIKYVMSYQFGDQKALNLTPTSKRPEPAWNKVERRSSARKQALQTELSQPAVTVEQITSIESELSELREALRWQGQLGLTGGREFLYLKNERGAPWHRKAGENLFEPVTAAALIGYVLQIKKVSKDRDRLHVVIKGNSEYVVSTGFETQASKGILGALSQLTGASMRSPLKFVPEVKKSTKSANSFVVMNVLLNDKTIMTKGCGGDVDALLKKAQDNLREARSPNRVAPVTRSASSKPVESVNWGKVCTELHITPDQLKELAVGLNLPIGKLDRSQSARLYHHAITTFK